MRKVRKIGLVTVTYNSATVIDAFLQSVRRQTYQAMTLYVVDNLSTDSTLSRIPSSDASSLVVIANDHNAGVAEGNNQGIRAALADGCDAVLLINNDTEFGPELVSTLCSELIRSGADMIVPKIMYFEPSDTIWCAGGTFRFRRGYSGEHYGLGERDSGQYDQLRQIEYSPTCCMLVRREVFDRIGEMDPKYFVYFDDTDFCFRAWKAGLRLVYTPQTVLYHKVSALTGGAETPFAIRYTTRNHVYFLLKNLGVLGGAFFLPAYFGKICLKRLMAGYSGETFAVALRGFFEGMSLSSRRSVI